MWMNGRADRIVARASRVRRRRIIGSCVQFVEAFSYCYRRPERALTTGRTKSRSWAPWWARHCAMAAELPEGLAAALLGAGGAGIVIIIG